jgi:TRAP-type mannitol/chloroaromatic compound transport system permease small subunit
MLRVARAIDRFTEKSALAFASLMAPLLVAVAWEVVARYAFDAPTSWAYETIYTLYAAMFMLGAAYALHRSARAHRLPVGKWPARTRAAIGCVAYLAWFQRCFCSSSPGSRRRGAPT